MAHKRSLLERLRGVFTEREAVVKAGFEETIALIVEGRESELADDGAVADMLTAAGKTTGDLAAAVDAERARRAQLSIATQLSGLQEQLAKVNVELDKHNADTAAQIARIRVAAKTKGQTLLAEQQSLIRRVDEAQRARTWLIENDPGRGALQARESANVGIGNDLREFDRIERLEDSKLLTYTRELRELEDRDVSHFMTFGSRMPNGGAERIKEVKAAIRGAEFKLNEVRAKKAAAQKVLDDTRAEWDSFEGKVLSRVGIS